MSITPRPITRAQARLDEAMMRYKREASHRDPDIESVRDVLEVMANNQKTVLLALSHLFGAVTDDV